MTRYGRTVASPWGEVAVAVDDSGTLHGIAFFDAGDDPAQALGLGEAPLRDRPACTDPVARQLQEYFAGRRRQFELRLHLGGTPFQRTVWQALATIPYGTTRSYGELAAQLGRPGAARAVGRANGQNPIPIVLPCHRVIGADGSLTGFGGGLGIKRALLALEGARLAGNAQL